MKNIKKIIAILLFAATLAVSMTAFGTSLEKEEQYIATILQLESWLETPGKPVDELESITASFDGLQSYKMSKGFHYYSSVLIKAIQENFDFDYKFWVSMLEQNESFQDYLQNDIDSLSILSVSEMLNYVKGREAESNGDIDAAVGFYTNAINFYDASDRYEDLAMSEYASKYKQARDLMNNNDLAGAYLLFAEINGYDDSAERMDYIKQVLGYDPVKETPAPTAVPTAEPTAKKAEIAAPAPTAAPDVKSSIPVLSQTYQGISAKLSPVPGDPNGRRFCSYGPGKEYEGAGGFKVDNKHSNRLTLYFCENDYILADIVYSTAFERYAYLPKYAISYADNVPKISALDYYEGKTTSDVLPLWGPDSSFMQDERSTIKANTAIKAFFRENDYVYAEFSCSLGTVRMWLPMDSVSFE